MGAGVRGKFERVDERVCGEGDDEGYGGECG